MLIFIKFWSTDSVQKWKKAILAKYLKPKQYHEIWAELTTQKILKGWYENQRTQSSMGSVENKPGWSNLIMIQSYKLKIVIVNIQFSICWIFWLENSLERKEANETSLARLWKPWICKMLEEQMWALSMPTGGMKRQLDKGKVATIMCLEWWERCCNNDQQLWEFR